MRTVRPWHTFARPRVAQRRVPTVVRQAVVERALIAQKIASCPALSPGTRIFEISKFVRALEFPLNAADAEGVSGAPFAGRAGIYRAVVRGATNSKRKRNRP